MLEEQCNTWGGITSVAVYLPLVYFQASNDNKLREAISHVENFHEQIDRTHGELSSLSRQPITPMHAIFCKSPGCSGLQDAQASNNNKLAEAISQVEIFHKQLDCTHGEHVKAHRNPEVDGCPICASTQLPQG